MWRNAFFISLLVVVPLMFGCSDEDATSAESSQSQEADQIVDNDLDAVLDEAKRISKASSSVDAAELLAMARRQVHAKDSAAQLVHAKYNRGNRNLCFKSATFTFNSPALKAANGRENSYRVKVSGGTMCDVEPVPYHWMDGVQVDPTPKKPLEAVLAAGFDVWWREHPQANLYMKLKIHSEYDDYQPENSPWLWLITGSGPGSPEDFRAYVAPETMEVLATERKEVAIR